MDCVSIAIEAFPLNVSPPKPYGPELSPKLLAILKKYKYNWRLDQLSKPTRITPKYVPVEEGLLRYERPKEKHLDEEVKFYSNQLATPTLKNLVCNKMLYGKVNKKLNRKLTRNIKKAWNSIYNFYRKKERDRRYRQLKRAEQKAKDKPKVFERVDFLAKPKPVYKPPPPKPGKIFEDYQHLDVLASPKVYIIQPPKREGVNPSALTYEPTEVVFRLAKIPDRFKKQPKPLMPGVVNRAALRYKITPRVESLAVPKRTREKAKEDDDFDPWAISKNALKYKATPRMLELAKPRE